MSDTEPAPSESASDAPRVRPTGSVLDRSGIVVVDKPAGMTSHDVVARCRRLFGTRRVGHAGTLDPMATGVLVIGIERATKLLGHLALTTKEYTATIRLGVATVTDDAEGEVTAIADASAVTDTAIAAAVSDLTGDIDQVPARVSAIKVDGKRAYARVREGEEVALAARPVTVSRFDIRARRVGDEPGTVDLDVEVGCSSGTYIRALARDLGAALGVGGHLTALRRTRVGPFDLSRARTLDALADAPEPSLGLDQAIALAFDIRTVSGDEAATLAHGRWLEPIGMPGVYAAVDASGTAIALLAEKGRRASTVFVVRPSNL